MNPSQATPTTSEFKYGESTPIMYPKNNLKSLSRKLWQKTNVVGRVDHSGGPNEDKWEKIKAPKFVNFLDIPDSEDSFFDNVNIVGSTPNSVYEHGKLPSLVGVEEEDDTLIASFSSVNLSEIKQDQHKKLHEVRTEDTKAKEEYGDNGNQPKFQQIKEKKEEIVKLKKPSLTDVKPFTFDLRDKQRQKQKQERINKILEEEKKMKVFRAKPLPKFLKSRPLYTNKNASDTNNAEHSKNTNDKADVTAHDKIKKMDIQKAPTKCTEAWKKPPFMPCLPKENSTRAKTPPLRTIVRSQQRKHFDENVKENQRQKEEAMQREIAAKKKQEEETIAQLRKQTVHKAQPIRKYKLLVVIEKRQRSETTDPMTPLSFKRRRHT